jgi:hypothetical protein
MDDPSKKEETTTRDEVFSMPSQSSVATQIRPKLRVQVKKFMTFVALLFW